MTINDLTNEQNAHVPLRGHSICEDPKLLQEGCASGSERVPRARQVGVTHHHGARIRQEDQLLAIRSVRSGQSGSENGFERRFRMEQLFFGNFWLLNSHFNAKPVCFAF